MRFVRMHSTRKRLRFVNDCLVCSRVGGIAAASGAIEDEKIAGCSRCRDLLIVQRTPVARTVNNRCRAESFGRKGQHDASPQTKLFGLRQRNEISAASSRTNKCNGTRLLKTFSNASSDVFDIFEGESRHLRLCWIDSASSKRNDGGVFGFHIHLAAIASNELRRDRTGRRQP
jgi:hypothetical protein